MPIVLVGDRLKALIIEWLLIELVKLLRERAESLTLVYNASLSTTIKATIVAGRAPYRLSVRRLY